MSKLTAVLADTFRGLVQRRLWPVAALLLAAVVAVPVLLTADPEPVVATPDLAAERDELAAQPLVAVASATEREDVRRVLGARKDPFKPSGRSKSKSRRDGGSRTGGRDGDAKARQSSAGTGAASGKAVPTAPAGGGGSYVAPAPLPSTSSPDPTAKRPSRPAGSLSVRWGIVDDEALESLTVERLDPLPTADEPLLVYLGLTEDGRSAVFMLDAGITVDGDGRCRPDPEDCQTVELAPGETEFIEVTGEDGAKTQFQLDLVKIHGRRAARASTLGKRATVEARATRRALRSLGQVAPTWRFDARTGTLAPTEAGDS